MCSIVNFYSLLTVLSVPTILLRFTVCSARLSRMRYVSETEVKSGPEWWKRNHELCATSDECGEDRCVVCLMPLSGSSTARGVSGGMGYGN